ncbi:PEP-CTERM sorting domain-containing protein [Nostoc sp. UHCC 0302]|uniref:PEP-CTERM sorting domain-containing protein n=1 Tax=Nostoc sp. UHCC 0302 TaxID=3134896 RepID=UPI00311CB2D3
MKQITQFGVAIAAYAVTWVSVALQAQAATVNLDNQGNITSVSSVVVNDSTYNVSFVYGRFRSVYDVPEPNSLYPTMLNSDLFGGSPPSDAINQALNQLMPIPGYISPFNAGVLSRSYFIPFRFKEFDGSYSVDGDEGNYIYDPDSPPNEQPFDNYWYGNYNVISDDSSETYAVFTPVPEPADILGSLTALGLVVAMKKKITI